MNKGLLTITIGKYKEDSVDHIVLRKATTVGHTPKKLDPN